MAALISFVHAKQHLAITTDDRDAEINLKLEEANALILARCNSTAYWRAITPTWTEATVPGGVKSAILIVLSHLFEHKGDDMNTDALLWPAVDHLIALNKDPVIA